jgi:isoleucyl-tRNA synthetase
LDSWFVKMTAVKDRLVNLNKEINWKPKATGEGRFANWLENVNDWNLSVHVTGEFHYQYGEQKTLEKN